MADALVTVAAEAILKKAVSIAANEVALALGYKDKLAELQKTSNMIRAKLSDADGKKSTGVVMEWLKQLNDVVGEVDDVLDEAHYEMLRRKVKKRNQAGKIFSFPSLKKLSFGRDMGHKIENINKELSQIYERANKLQLQDEQFEPAGNSYDRDTVPYLDKFKIIGRENEKRSLVGLLTNLRGEEPTIVPIVGMGGIGKTTLAKSIYNNPKIEQHFDVMAWLCVSVKVKVNTLLANIYKAFGGKEAESLVKVNLIENLQKKLGSKRYLLVLDDVWDEDWAYWDDFRNCMLQVKSDHGSGIIVTARNLNIGRNATNEDSYALECLSNDDSWSMFKERASPPSLKFERIGHNIVKKCRGLPLLVDILGRMLRRHNTDLQKWLSIQESRVWDEEEEGRVLSILKLSFDNLPNSMVKQCFLYCSIYEKDEAITREEVVQLWMALGLVQTDTTRNKEMEEVGNDIFQILVNSSLFQKVEKGQFGDIKSCQMHDLVHDLVLSLSRHETLCLVAATSDDVQIPPVKHLVLYQSFSYMGEVKERISFRKDMTRTLQTLFFMGGVKESISFRYFKCLRILKLSLSSLDEVPESVGELVHLRYLDLSYTRIRTLPKSFGKLYHLQTLKLLSCPSIEFPQEMRNLISLRHLVYESHILPPKDVGLLTSLRTLRFFQVGQQKGRQIEELGHLKHLGGKLSICNLEEIDSKEEALKADLHGKQNLYEIEFHWSSCDEGGNRNDKDVLEGLQPAANVKSLEIESYSGNSFPEWAMKMKIKTERNWTPLAKLVKIKLAHCHNCLNIPMLEGLTSLQSLYIWDCPSLLEIPDLHNQRCSLKDLTVVKCNKLTCLPGGFDCLSLLNELAIGPFSEELHSFPSLSGIEKLGNHLHTLWLYGWEHWESIPEEIKHLTTLRDLRIWYFGVRELPMWLTNMSSIREIEFWECRGLNEESVLQGAPREATRVELNGYWIRRD